MTTSSRIKKRRALKALYLMEAFDSGCIKDLFDTHTESTYALRSLSEFLPLLTSHETYKFSFKFSL